LRTDTPLSGDDVRMSWAGANHQYQIVVRGDVGSIAVTRDGFATATFVDASPHLTSGSFGFSVRGGAGTGNYILADDIALQLDEFQPTFPGNCS